MQLRQGPLVSLVTPTYNRAAYLREAIRSASAQTYPNLEILVFDDASPDETEEVVRELQEIDNRIEYVRHPENLGLVPNWRAGVEAARGDFFCILGDDDTIEPTFIERLVRPLLEDDDLALAFCDHWVMDKQSRRLEDATDANTVKWRRNQLPAGKVEDIHQTALVDRALWIGSVLFRASAVPPSAMPDESRAFLDYWMVYQAITTGGGYYVPERLCTCRWQESGVSRNWRWRLFNCEGSEFYYRRLLRDPELEHFREEFLASLADSLVTHGNTLLTLGNRELAREKLQEGLSIERTPRGIMGYMLAHAGPAGSWASGVLRVLREKLLSGSAYPRLPEVIERTGG